MNTKTKCYVIYGNHPEGLKAVDDLANIIKESLADSEIFEEICFSKDVVENHTNIIIEEFSSKKFCKKLLSHKEKNNNTHFYLIITEIPINNSFNNFNNKKSKFINTPKNKFLNYGHGYAIYLLNYKIKKILNIILNIIFNIIRYFLSENYDKFKLKFMKFFNDLKNSINNRKEKDQLVVDYFYIRYHNCKILINNSIFTEIFIINNSSKKITDSSFSCNSHEFPYKVLLGEIRNKSNMMLFSGTPTIHRQKIISKLIDLSIDVVCNFNFNDQIRNKYSDITKFSLHISRYESDTEYSSPTRTLQALKNRMIPISYKKCLDSNMEEFLGIDPLVKLLLNANTSHFAKTLEDYYDAKIRTIENTLLSYNMKSLDKIHTYFK